MKKALMIFMAVALAAALILLLLQLLQPQPAASTPETTVSDTEPQTPPARDLGKRVAKVVKEYSGFRYVYNFTYNEDLSQATAQLEGEGIIPEETHYTLEYDASGILVGCTTVTPTGTQKDTYLYTDGALMKTVSQELDGEGRLLAETASWTDMYGRISFTIETRGEETTRTDYAYAFEGDSDVVQYAALVVGNQFVGEIYYTCNQAGEVIQADIHNRYSTLIAREYYENGLLVHRQTYNGGGAEVVEDVHYTYDDQGRLIRQEATYFGEPLYTMTVEYLES